MADADLLEQRMMSLGLSPAAVEKRDSVVMGDLRETCSGCSLKSRCRRDLASMATTAAVADYCPNEATLAALRRSWLKPSATGGGAL